MCGDVVRWFERIVAVHVTIAGRESVTFALANTVAPAFVRKLRGQRERHPNVGWSTRGTLSLHHLHRRRLYMERAHGCDMGRRDAW